MSTVPLWSLLMPMQDWPDLDRHLWKAGTTKRRPLDKPAYAAGLSPKSVYFAEQAYSRWLSVLAMEGVLDPLLAPGSRATPEHLDLFVEALRAEGNVDNTIAARIWGLRSALRIMHPGEDFRWLTSPDGHNINSLLPATPRELFVPDALVLFEWGFELIDQAAKHANPMDRQTLHRNGVIIALLAARAPRLRTLAGMRLGRHVQRNGTGFHLNFEIEDLKAPKPLAYSVPARLVPAIERYLDVERVELLQGKMHDWFWVGRGGDPLDLRGIDAVIRRASSKRFQQTFGPQRFRYALVTTFATHDPVHAEAASSILGHTSPVREKYYNRGKQADAARRTNVSLEEDREETRLLAQRLFADRH